MDKCKLRTDKFNEIGYEIGSPEAHKLVVENGMDKIATIRDDFQGPEWQKDKDGYVPVCGGIPSPRVLLRTDAEKLVKEGVLRKEQVSYWEDKE